MGVSAVHSRMQFAPACMSMIVKALEGKKFWVFLSFRNGLTLL